jgi:hypothetical protein
MGSPSVYDRIGDGYALVRRADPRIASAIDGALGDAGRVVNIGAGAGSYEARPGLVVAVEPSLNMLAQRPRGAASALRARAEALPFADRAFDAALGVLTIQHWRDWRAGLRESARVAGGRVVLFTWDPEHAGFWLTRDYLPGVLAADRARFPAMGALVAALGAAEVVPVQIPHDCSDGFLGAYWRRPRAYLDPAVRAAISGLAAAPAQPGLERLARDLEDGAWTAKHGDVRGVQELDLGYRLVVGRPR